MRLLTGPDFGCVWIKKENQLKTRKRQAPVVVCVCVRVRFYVCVLVDGVIGWQLHVLGFCLVSTHQTRL